MLLDSRDLRGEGWRWCGARWAALAYLLPLAYATVAYGAVWLAGLGAVDLARFRTGVVPFVVLGSVQSLLSATGEELGWRGFLVPTLARTMSFGWTALVSGAIWAAWHLPLILFADYNAGTPAWFAVPCFVVMVGRDRGAARVAPAADGQRVARGDQHASHNLYVQGFFDTVTVNTGPTRWLTTRCPMTRWPGTSARPRGRRRRSGRAGDARGNPCTGPSAPCAAQPARAR